MQYQIDFLFSVTWKKINDVLKSFYFHKKSSCPNRTFVFILSNCHGNTSFMKEFEI